MGLDKNNRVWKKYYENGQIKEEGNYIDDVEEYTEVYYGLWKYYHENGQIKQEGNYIDDEKDGVWKEYYANGQLKREENWKYCKLGICKEYYENGQIKLERTPDADGNWMWKEFDIDGNPIETPEPIPLDDIIHDIYNNIEFVTDSLNELLDLDFDKDDIELYFGYKYEYRWAVWQNLKNDDSTDVISEFSEDYVRDGMDDEEYIKEMFDETSEVHEGWAYSVWLNKINSKDFVNKFKERVLEWSKSKDDEFFYLFDFMEWVKYDDVGVNSLESFYEHLGGDLNNFESVLDEVDIDESDNLISWYSYGQLDQEYLQIGYRKILRKNKL